MRRKTAATAGALIGFLLAGCATGTPAAPPPSPLTAPSAPPSPTLPATRTATSAPVVTWQVGARPLPLRPDGFGQIQPTPPELVNRSLPTQDFLPPPASTTYTAKIAEVPDAVLKRSTWQAACPVSAADLRYVTLSFWGFDHRVHTGELLVRKDAAAAVVKAFSELYAQQFPIEEMRITSPAELGAPPTGDGNDTSAFVCRPMRGQKNWSAHAYGLAVDVNPFCNPYTKDDLVVPELASAYLDRAKVRPGMVTAGGPVVRAFAAAGWQWGGAWKSPVDRMHFTANGE
ncbi:M15 family metallopeptidase [Amycolatopsis sp. VS8301801F10]|uniref:M15 family metallopeptidase n=1 Tax=Amycolatopsis sp. VS8301801F10 TaxID=2652442 RepID=UPI0038FD056C